MDTPKTLVEAIKFFDDPDTAMPWNYAETLARMQSTAAAQYDDLRYGGKL